MSRSGSVTVAAEALGAIKQALNESGWLDGEVVAAGDLRQGKPLTITSMITGTALIELARPRRSKSLPRHFVLAATADRVVAFKALGYTVGEDSDATYMLKIKPGECGSWPRASVRMLDLPDGPHSNSATLELDGSERLPVARPNLEGDPDTDELIELLSGEAPRPSSPTSARRERRVENQRQLRRAAAVRAGDHRELGEEARRGRPLADLRGWAERRGLSHRGNTSQGGHLSVTCPWSEDVLFNVVRGPWPGGALGVLCHEARLCDVDTTGVFHGSDVIGPSESWTEFVLDAFVPLPVGGGSSYFKVPYTCAGTRVPHLATVSGLHVARRAERHTTADSLLGIWRERPLDDLGLDDHWVAGIRKHSDEDTVERLLAGPIRELLSVQQGLGFEIRIEYGQVIVARQDFLRHDHDLDALVAMTEALAAAVREICVPRSGRLALETPLPPPEWLASMRRSPRKKHTLWPIGARLDTVARVADERGMAIEDPRAFHVAFPGLNVPGEPFGVLHGRLRGTALTGRLLCCAERRMVLPEDFRKLLSDPGGAAGCDVAVLPVRDDAPATAPEGEVEEDGLRVAVADGVLTAWRVRGRWQADGEALDRLAADVAGVVARRGLVR